MIAWKYIDRNAATVAAIRDYDNMRVIINVTPDDIKELYVRMVSPHTANMSGMPSAYNPQANEERLAAQLDKLDILRERYAAAVEYMTWFEPAWGTLTDTEQHILREFYMDGNQKSGATYRLMNELSYSERTIDRKRGNALKHLNVLLYG